MSKSRSDTLTRPAGEAVFTQCLSCTHFVAMPAYPGGPVLAYCPPFPGGIADDIFKNRFDHRQAHPDEAQPVRFSPRADVSPRVLAALYRRLDGVAPHGPA
jgi:hypothetical protein